MQTIHHVHAQLLTQNYLGFDHVDVFAPHLPDTHQGVYHTPFSAPHTSVSSVGNKSGRPSVQTMHHVHAHLLAQNNEVLIMLKWFDPHLPDPHQGAPHNPFSAPKP